MEVRTGGRFLERELDPFVFSAVLDAVDLDLADLCATGLDAVVL
jgi:hypothetical protein